MENLDSRFTNKSESSALYEMFFSIRSAIFVLTLSLCSPLFAANGESLLNKTVSISGFGNIRYRAPIAKSETHLENGQKRFPIVLTGS